MINTYTASHLRREIPEINVLLKMVPSTSIEFDGLNTCLAAIKKILEYKTLRDREKEKFHTAKYDLGRQTFCLSRDRTSLLSNANQIMNHTDLPFDLVECLDIIIMLSKHLDECVDTNDGLDYIQTKAILCSKVKEYYRLRNSL